MIMMVVVIAGVVGDDDDVVAVVVVVWVVLRKRFGCGRGGEGGVAAAGLSRRPLDGAGGARLRLPLAGVGWAAATDQSGQSNRQTMK